MAKKEKTSLDDIGDFLFHLDPGIGVFIAALLWFWSVILAIKWLG